jgi:hypothetical protein
VLTTTEDAHLKIMSTFETDEHLRGADANAQREGREAGGQPKVKLKAIKSPLPRSEELPKAVPKGWQAI